VILSLIGKATSFVIELGSFFGLIEGKAILAKAVFSDALGADLE
jgi:hypothetical protein